MDKIEVEGISKLEGVIQISGSKNSSLPILASSLLIDEEIIISNVPNLSDVIFMIKILESLDSKVNFEYHSCKIKSNQPANLKISYDLVRKMRASFLILGPLLTKYGYAEVSLPGGCAIGTRPVDFHINALEKTVGKKAIINFKPMQMGDVKLTSANTSALEDWINFKPNTLIEDGINKFVEWYKFFYKV